MTYVLIILFWGSGGNAVTGVPGFATHALCQQAVQAVVQNGQSFGRGVVYVCAEHSPLKVEAERGRP